jgi:5-methylthioadenosine/S-adenosylhomocysteine deaminase
VGTGFPPIDQARAAGLDPGLSGDNEVSYALSMFTEMQMLLSKHRGSVFGRITAGDQDPPAQLAPSDLLRYATVGGAANAGLSGKVGSLTPGKQADIILIRTTDVNTAPGTNAVATVTAFAHPGNVDIVLVAGQVRKWPGKLTGHDVSAVVAQAVASRDYLFAAGGQRPDVLAGNGTSPL